MPRQRFPGRHKRNCRLIFCSRENRASLRRECLALHAINSRPAIQRRYGHSQRGFRQPVNRQLRFATKPVFCEALSEALQGFRIHRLCAIQRRAPRTEVHSLNVLVRNLPHAKLVRKIRRRRNRSPMLVKRLQPFLGTRQKSQRRHHHDGKPKMQRREPRANQSHIVI